MLLFVPWDSHLIYFLRSPPPSSVYLQFQRVLHYSSISSCFKALTCLSPPRLTGTYQGCGELSLRLHEQHALVHSSQATEGLRRSRDTEKGTRGWKTPIWMEDQIHLTDRREEPEKSTSESHHVSLTILRYFSPSTQSDFGRTHSGWCCVTWMRPFPLLNFASILKILSDNCHGL